MDRNEVIDECIKVVEGLIKPNCDDHTPFWGACVSCGNSKNPDVLPEPEEVIEALENLKTKRIC